MSIQGHPTPGCPIHGHSTPECPIQGHPIQGRSTPGCPIHRRPTPGRAIQGRPTPGCPIPGAERLAGPYRWGIYWGECFLGQHPASSVHLGWKPAAKRDCGKRRSILVLLPPCARKQVGGVRGGRDAQRQPGMGGKKIKNNKIKKNPLMRAAGGKTLSPALRFLSQRALCRTDNPAKIRCKRAGGKKPAVIQPLPDSSSGLFPSAEVNKPRCHICRAREGNTTRTTPTSPDPWDQMG